MASALKAFNVANIDASLVTVYTGPAGVAALVHNLMVANILGSATTYSVTFTDDSAGVTTYLVKDAPLAAGETQMVLGDNNKQVVEEDDVIQVQGGASNSVDVTGAVLENPV